MIDRRGMTLRHLIAELQEIEKTSPDARVQVFPGGREVVGVHHPLPVKEASDCVVPLWAPPPE